MNTYSGPAFMQDTGRDVNKVKVMLFDLRKPTSSLTKEHDILVKDLEHFFLLCVMIRNHWEGYLLIERCGSAPIKCNECLAYTLEPLTLIGKSALTQI